MDFRRKAAGCIERLLGADGLLPISVSHEGYLAQPVHSYWDDFWALRGFRDAAHLARAAGPQMRGAANGKSSRRASRASLLASIEPPAPSAARLCRAGSSGRTSIRRRQRMRFTCSMSRGPDRKGSRPHLRRVSRRLARRASGARESTELLAIRDPHRRCTRASRPTRRGAGTAEFFLSDRRPPPWNQWPEIAWRDRAGPAHLGDLPHTWIAAEYVLALRSLFAYEREADRSLVLAAGLAPEWIEGAGVQVNQMPTLYGKLSYSLRRIDSDTRRIEIGSGITGRMILRPPLAAAAAPRDRRRPRMPISMRTP